MNTDKRPVLLGMNNPLSLRPEHALFPYPPGCTGHRVLELLRTRVPGVTRGQYLAAFDRRNLVMGQWCRTAARAAAVHFAAEMRHTGRTVLVFGEEPRVALGLPRELVHPIERDGAVWRMLPHPSGRNRWYNDERNCGVAALLLEELYAMSTGGEENGDGAQVRRDYAASKVQ